MSDADPMVPAEQSADEAETRQFVNGSVQCTAHTRQGNRCARPAVRGATVCRFHGGAAPQVQRKAALRLAELVDPAIGTLAKEMLQAKRSSDRQRAANSILDRAGVPRRVQEVERETSREILVSRLMEVRQRQLEDEADEPTEDPDDPRPDDDSSDFENEEDQRRFEILRGQLVQRAAEISAEEADAAQAKLPPSLSAMTPPSPSSPSPTDSTRNTTKE